MWADHGTMFLVGKGMICAVNLAPRVRAFSGEVIPLSYFHDSLDRAVQVNPVAVVQHLQALLCYLERPTVIARQWHRVGGRGLWNWLGSVVIRVQPSRRLACVDFDTSSRFLAHAARFSGFGVFGAISKVGELRLRHADPAGYLGGATCLAFEASQVLTPNGVNVFHCADSIAAREIRLCA